MSFADGLNAVHDEVVLWNDSRLRYRIYITDGLPPSALITSSRAVVFRGGSVVVIRTGDGHAPHVMPGGRLRDGESLEDAARREVLEECGWTIGDLKPFAILHFRHLTPRPADYPYPYPDFVQVVHVTKGISYRRGALRRVRHGELEIGSRLVPIRQAFDLIRAGDKVLLRAAIAET